MVRHPARIPGINLLLISLSLAGAFCVDQFLLPHERFRSGLFAVSVLIAAYRLPTLGASVTAVLTLGLAAMAADLNNLSLLSAPLEPIGVLLISVLAILLSHQRRVSAQLGHDAQNLLEQAQSARNTLHTHVETLPAGVVVAAPVA
jgi:hypothetical protein